MANPHILILSDLNWHADSKRINREDVLLLFESQTLGHGHRFRNVGDYYNIVSSEEPTMVIFAGDVTGDGSCGHGFHTAFYYLLSLLQLNSIPALFLRGDNDLDDYYRAVTQNLSSLPLIEEISDSIVHIQGLKILGISYQTTASKKQMSNMLKEVEGQVIDLVVCHAQLKRRTALLSIKADCLITGHFDNKLFEIDGETVVSLSNDSEVINYSKITYEDSVPSYKYVFTQPRRKLQISYRLGTDADSLYVNDLPVNITEYEQLKLPQSSYDKDKNALALSVKFLRGQAYKRGLEFMKQAKSGGLKIDKALLAEHMKEPITSKHRLSKSMLVDYLGNEVWPYLKKVSKD